MNNSKYRHPEKVKPKKDKEFWARLGKGYLHSQIFKPINTARRQVTMKRIACTIKGVEMRICIKMVSRAEVMLIKIMQKGDGSGLVVGVITIWSSTNEGVEMKFSVNMGGRTEVMFIKALETGGVVPPPQTVNILTPTPPPPLGVPLC